jgi:hypothetical protein
MSDKLFRITKLGPRRTNQGVVYRTRQSDVTEAINYAAKTPGYEVLVEEADMPDFTVVFALEQVDAPAAT